MKWNECINRKKEEKKNSSKRKQKSIYKGAAVAFLNIHLFTVRYDALRMNGWHV